MNSLKEKYNDVIKKRFNGKIQLRFSNGSS